MSPRHLLAGTLALLTFSSLQAQSTLADRVSEARAGWMITKWEAQTDNGETIALSFSWDLEKHVIVLHGKLPDSEFKGYTFAEPGSETVGYTAFDNHGALTKGTWTFENEQLVLRVETRSEDRGTWKMAVAFSGNETDGLQARVHGVDSSGNLESPARTTLKFKKSK